MAILLNDILDLKDLEKARQELRCYSVEDSYRGFLIVLPVKTGLGRPFSTCSQHPFRVEFLPGRSRSY